MGLFDALRGIADQADFIPGFDPVKDKQGLIGRLLGMQGGAPGTPPIVQPGMTAPAPGGPNPYAQFADKRGPFSRMFTPNSYDRMHDAGHQNFLAFQAQQGLQDQQARAAKNQRYDRATEAILAGLTGPAKLAHMDGNADFFSPKVVNSGDSVFSGGQFKQAPGTYKAEADGAGQLRPFNNVTGQFGNPVGAPKPVTVADGADLLQGGQVVHSNPKTQNPLVQVNTGDDVKPSSVPSGWEGYYDENGSYNLRPSPGGPADIESRAGESSKRVMDAVISTFATKYQQLNEAGAVRNSEKGPVENFQAYMQTTPMGREYGKMTGSKAEAARETIEAMQPNIVQAIMSQPGISARAFDSDKELEFFLRSITAPRSDYMANMSALYILDKKFGTGTSLQQVLTPDELASVEQFATADPLSFQLDSIMDAPQATSQQAEEPFDESLLEYMTPEELALFGGSQ